MIKIKIAMPFGLPDMNANLAVLSRVKINSPADSLNEMIFENPTLKRAE